MNPLFAKITASAEVGLSALGEGSFVIVDGAPRLTRRGVARVVVARSWPELSRQFTFRGQRLFAHPDGTWSRSYTPQTRFVLCCHLTRATTRSVESLEAALLENRGLEQTPFEAIYDCGVSKRIAEEIEAWAPATGVAQALAHLSRQLANAACILDPSLDTPVTPPDYKLSQIRAIAADLPWLVECADSWPGAYDAAVALIAAVQTLVLPKRPVPLALPARAGVAA